MKKHILFSALLILASFLFTVNISAQQTTDTSEQVSDLKEEIEKLEKKLSNLSDKEASLAKEIEYADGQINLTELRIRNSQQKLIEKENAIQKLSGDIEDLRVRIEKLGKSIAYQEVVLKERLRSRYKTLESSPLILLFGSHTLDNIVQKSTYLKVMELQDHKLIKNMSETKNAYDTQKNLFEDKKSKEEDLKAQIITEKSNLESYRSQLDDQKQQKEDLLEQTQNDENKYQELLNQARAELQAIEGIVSSVNFKNGEKVQKGDVIAVMGNSGYPDCSTGPHLHFEVRKNGKIVDAENYLKSKKLYVYDFSSGYKNIGDGDWSWPMKDPTINQRFGDTPWSWRYASGEHSGIDMESSDTFIYAPEDGTIVKSTQGCYGSTINYAAIDHGDGIVSYYLHVQ